MSIKKQNFILKPVDFFIIFLFLCFFIVSFSMIVTGQEKLVLEISTPSENYEYDLKQDNRISVKGILGVTEITIRDGQVWVEDSPCQNKTCVHQGKISSGGRWLCCAPNQVFAIIKNQGSETDLSVKTDALSF